MEKKGGGWVSAVILGVPLIVAIVLAVLMGYVNISKWTGVLHLLQLCSISVPEETKNLRVGVRLHSPVKDWPRLRTH